MGDRVLNISLPKIGEKALFTKDLEDALRNGVVDFVVHSLKDLPTALPDGMTIGAILEREDPRDALVLSKSHDGKSLSSLPDGSVIGTSSLRRTAQLSRKYPKLKVKDVRGNLNTRLAKLDAENSEYAAIILAQAGLVRMGWHDRISQTLEADDILYAVGQGALAVECRVNDDKILKMLQKLTCLKTVCRILSERSFLKTLGGGCSAPVAVVSTLSKHRENEHELKITGAVWSLNGQTEIINSTKCNLPLKDENDDDGEDDDDNDEIIPKKKAKLSEEDEIDSEAKRSPEIVDHSKATQDNLDIAGLINAHGDSFKKCPFSMKLVDIEAIHCTQNASCAGDESSIRCPLAFPVGEDVMGKCPYFDASDKNAVTNLQSIQSSSNETTSHSDVKLCPYSKGKKSCDKKCEEKPKKTSKCPISKVELGPDVVSKCPFLASTSSLTTNDNVVQTNQLETPTTTLYCGIYPHKCWPEEVFQKCDELGKTLAKSLIDDGALKVMQIAQNEIHSSIKA